MVETLGSGDSLIAKYSEEERDAIRDGLGAGQFIGVNIARHLRHTPQTLDHLVGLPNLKSLHVQDLDIDLGSLDRFPDLEQLKIGETRQTLDLARLPRLRELSAVWHPRLLINETESHVSSLHLWKYRPQTPDLEQAPRFPRLACLELVQSNITSLNGIEAFRSLRRLELHHLSKLAHLTELPLDRLQVFIAHGCPRIEDHEQLRSCRKLEILNLSRAGAIKSIKFISDLPNLWTFRFLDSAIRDGDYSPLHRLEDVFFSHRRTLKQKVTDFRQGSKNLAIVLRLEHQY